MTTTTSLIMDFIDDVGESRRISYANVDGETPSSAIRTLVSAIVTNSGELLNQALVSCKSAVIRTTTDTTVDLSD